MTKRTWVFMQPYDPDTESVDAYTDDVCARIVRRAIEYMPELAGLSILRAWTGFRAATEDKLPLIGPCAGHRGLYLATGHEGLGITTSLGTARLIADRIVGRPPAIPAEPFLPLRLLGSVADE